MYPVNQVFLGSDPMMSSLDDLDMQIQRMEAYRNKLKQMQSSKPQMPTKLIWDEIDAEVSPMTDEQKARLFQNEDYVLNYNEIQALVQSEILNLVKGRIESTERGRELLNSQLKIVKKLKTKIIDDTNKEMEMFMKFKEFSKTNPTITYEEFIKSNI
jgi:hypothetical protein